MGVRVNSGVTLNDTGRLIVDIVGHAPNVSTLYITSGMDGDHGTVSHHYGLSYAGSPTAAVDAGGGGVTTAGSRNMRDFARWVYTTFPGDVVELIHTTPYADDQGFYIRHGLKVPNGTGWLDTATMAAHLNHVHLAMSRAGALAVKARLAGTSAPDNGAALFVDVSFHDWDRRGGPIDWAAVASAGVGTVMSARASYGDPVVFSPPSPRFGEYMTAASAAGFSCRGSYHNLIRGDAASVARQVDLLRSTMDRYGGEWPMADVEAYPELVTRGLVPDWATVQRFHDRWYQVESQPMVWYIARWIWRDHLGSPSLTGLRGPLINADYPGVTGTPASAYAAAGGDTGRGWAPFGGRVPDAWQFSSTVTVPGASDRTDCNAFRGDRAALVALLTGGTVPNGGTDDMPKVLRVREDGAIWVTNGPQRWYISAPVDMDEAVAAWGPWREIDRARLGAYGADVAAPTVLDLADADVAAIVDGLVAKLPAGTMTRSDVEAAVRDAFAGGLAPDATP